MLFESIATLLLMIQAAASPATGQGRIAAATENPDEMICRAPQPAIGSRVARRRVCRTRAEWRAFQADRAQAQRDLQAGNCAGARTCSE
jgi:hypothetical protein